VTEDRRVDLLKHVSTLNVAALVLFLTLLRDFRAGNIVPGVPTATLILFGISLLAAMAGLFISVGASAGTRNRQFYDAVVGWTLVASYGTFFAGLSLAVFLGFRAI
jgi:hypothetical protein